MHGAAKTLAALVATVASPLVSASTADAGIVAIETGLFCSGECRYGEAHPVPRLTFEDARGERNEVRIEAREGRVTVRDGSAALTAGGGCDSQGTGVVTCSFDGPLYQARILLGAGDDVLSIDGNAGGVRGGFDGRALLDGGVGDDRVTGGDGHETLAGGPGRDVLHGGPGSDDFAAAAELGAPDAFVGGDGRDFVSYESATVPVSIRLASRAAIQGPPGERDRLIGVEEASGGRGADVIVGSHADERLDGTYGPDRLYGGGGSDHIRGGSGADLLDSGAGDDTLAPGNEGTRDRVVCGPGSDRAGTRLFMDVVDESEYVDGSDLLLGCEQLLLRGPYGEGVFAPFTVLATGASEVLLATPCRKRRCEGIVRMTYLDGRRLAARAAVGPAGRTTLVLRPPASRALARQGRLEVRLALSGRVEGSYSTELRSSSAGGDA